MSKLDRQTDQAISIAPIKITWQAFDDVDVGAIRQQLRVAIDTAEHRVPLDCRDVDGAPNELLDILLDVNEYAKQRGKQVTLAFASNDLRQALRPGVYRRTAKVNDVTSKRVDAAAAAAESLHERIASYNRPDAKPATSYTAASVKVKKGKDSLRLLKLIGIALAGGACMGGVEWYLIFNAEETIDISQFVEEKKQWPIKSHEK